MLRWTLLALAASGHDVTLSVDPSVSLIGGGSAAIDVTPVTDVGPHHDALRLQLGAFYAPIAPALLPLVVTHGPASLHVDELAVRVAALYVFGDTGLFLGPEVFVYGLRYSDTRSHAHVDTAEAYAHATVGWRWLPFYAAPWERLFVMPWATLGVPIFGTGSVHTAALSVHDRRVNAHASVNLGVRLW